MNAGVAERTVSVYLFVLAGLALISVPSPLIVLSVPVLLLFGYPALEWWRRRSDLSAVSALALSWTIVATALCMLLLVGLGAWWLATVSPRPPEAFLMFGLAGLLAPLLGGAISMEARRRRSRR